LNLPLWERQIWKKKKRQSLLFWQMKTMMLANTKIFVFDPGSELTIPIAFDSNFSKAEATRKSHPLDVM
jgi:hypothetical protein